jgi:hypothetical protein
MLHTSFATQHRLRDLSWGSGFFPSRLRNSSPAVQLPRSNTLAFGVWKGLVGVNPLALPVLYLQSGSRDARPKAISGRTSYLQVRLAYHPYPHVIQNFCNSYWFVPPRGVSHASHCTWVAHQVSCLMNTTLRPLQTRFRCASGCLSLKLAISMNSAAHSPKGTPSDK